MDFLVSIGFIGIFWFLIDFLELAFFLTSCLVVGGLDLDSLFFKPCVLVASYKEWDRNCFTAVDIDFILEDALLDDIFTENVGDFFALKVSLLIKTAIKLPVLNIIHIGQHFDHTFNSIISIR